MVVVAVGAILMLRNYFPEVSTSDGVSLVVIATLFSGIIAYILFPQDKEEKPDPIPVNTKKKTKK